jgi:hypothetical protein
MSSTLLGSLKKTSRGFEVVEFTDSNGRQCILQQSSAIGDSDGAMDHPGTSYLWLGIQDAEAPSIHLNREQVKGLIGRLQHWLADGGFDSVKASTTSLQRIQAAEEPYEQLLPDAKELAGVIRVLCECGSKGFPTCNSGPDGDAVVVKFRNCDDADDFHLALIQCGEQI